ncbi:MAG: transcriptional repressor [Candidatus Aminicenantes bacterium]|nr:transcriptional repressor [Candidatus Aminicenantes bacterium]
MPGPWWHGRFRGCGYRITMPRQAILGVLSGTKEHLSAEDIYLRVHKIYPSSGLTTVYRTLELLTEMGLVVKFDFGDGRGRYELSQEHNRKQHHHHLVCRKCKRVIDYSDFIQDELELLRKTTEGLSRKYGFKIEDHEIVFKGLCEKCKKGGG